MPRLPPEMWTAIIRFVTLVPDAFNWSCWSTLNDDTVPLCPSRDINMKEKRVVSLVCRAWRKISLPYLFEIIHISGTALLPYVNIFDPHDQDAPSPCRFTRKVEVDLHRGGRPLTWDMEVLLLRILQRCHNLQIYKQTLDIDDPLSESIYKILFQHCGASLRLVFLQGIEFPEDWAEILASSAPRIESFATPQELEDCGGSEIELPNLHTLHIGPGSDSGYFKWRLPRLQHFIQGSMDWEDVTTLPLMAESAETLRILDIGSYTKEPPLQRLLDAYPMLDTLIIPIGSFIYPPESPSGQYPRIRCIGMGLHTYCPDGILTKSIGAFLNLLEHFPSLRKVRLIDHDRWMLGAEPSHLDFWRKCATMAQNRNVRLETRDGKLLWDASCLAEGM
jgi:hypothetical protein